jgi:hypothetical protein
MVISGPWPDLVRINRSAKAGESATYNLLDGPLKPLNIAPEKRNYAEIKTVFRNKINNIFEIIT